MKRASCVKARNKGTADNVLYNKARGEKERACVSEEKPIRLRHPLLVDSASHRGQQPNSLPQPILPLFVLCLFFMSSASFDVFITS